MAETTDKIKTILGEVKSAPGLSRALSDEADIINDVRLDSLQIISFILRVEEEFDIEFDFDAFEYDHLRSITAFCNFISRQKAA